MYACAMALCWGHCWRACLQYRVCQSLSTRSKADLLNGLGSSSSGSGNGTASSLLAAGADASQVTDTLCKMCAMALEWGVRVCC
jgi:tRNA U54 and U55 pseudouridine synthase Pus10